LNLNDYYYLPRASRYTNPLNGADRLPLPYGDLTDGANGIWELPCIDTVSFVYCYSAAAVLSVANGNSINIYADGVLVDPGNYVFSESNNYEAEGAIATVTFTSSKGNAIISARGKGVASGATLYENIIDIADDFLTVQNDFSSGDFEATAKAMAAQVFTGQSYKAAGVISEDAGAWTILQQMMGSFLGAAYLNAQGKLVLEIDDNVIRHTQADIIPRGETDNVVGRERAANIINRCPCNYNYNYVTRGFANHTDASADGNLVSQAIFGERKPSTPYQFYWCRDLTSVQAVQAIIVDKFSMPTWEISLDDITLKRAHIDTGDVVAVTAPALYDRDGQQMINQLVKITTKQPYLGQGRISFEALDTGAFMMVAHLADGSYLADGSVKAGGDRDTTIY